MQELTQEGRRALDDIARRHGVSPDAALTLLRAVAAGGGTMAQFSHPELGGMGQWTAGGMVMVGDMFNYGLKQRVAALCVDLAALLRECGCSPRRRLPGARRSVAVVAARAGQPAASGAQNDMRYACFRPRAGSPSSKVGGARLRYRRPSDQRRLAAAERRQSLVFTSQLARSSWRSAGRGRRRKPGSGRPRRAPGAPPCTGEPPAHSEPLAMSRAPPWPGRLPPGPVGSRCRDPLALIERLADLHQRGILSDRNSPPRRPNCCAGSDAGGRTAGLRGRRERARLPGGRAVCAGRRGSPD